MEDDAQSNYSGFESDADESRPVEKKRSKERSKPAPKAESDDGDFESDGEEARQPAAAQEQLQNQEEYEEKREAAASTEDAARGSSRSNDASPLDRTNATTNDHENVEAEAVTKAADSNERDLEPDFEDFGSPAPGKPFNGSQPIVPNMTSQTEDDEATGEDDFQAAPNRQDAPLASSAPVETRSSSRTPSQPNPQREQPKQQQQQQQQQKQQQQQLPQEPPSPPPPQPQPQQAPPPEARSMSHEQFQLQNSAQIHARIKTVVKSCSGPSFNERIKAASRAYKKENKRLEDYQHSLLEDALARAKTRPCASAPRQAALVPASIEERYKVNTEKRKQKEAEFAKAAAQNKGRLNSREPIFRVSEVQAVFAAQEKQKTEHRKFLREQEEAQWEHIRSLQAKVISRPLLVENYQGPEHVRSLPELRLIPNHTKETPLQAKVHSAIERKDFLESAWGKEVEAIRERQNNRQKLHEIPYPPKVHPKKVLGPRELMPVEVKMEAVINTPWYQKSEWAERVREIKQRMDDRPKLHEISYPPKR
mmetsp:Transcript_75273/g.164223  ORF Transcript_75273/g.164223 Transcript_75273/m.164223 type:complete len:536 (+) Transcript_75273:184-1791(+)